METTRDTEVISFAHFDFMNGAVTVICLHDMTNALQTATDSSL